MGWTASYQLLRDRPLDDDELAALADFCDRNNRPPWEGESFGLVATRASRADGVVADGWQKLPMSEDSDDLERLCDVLNRLQALLPGVEVRVSDDFGAFGWDAKAGRVTTSGAPGPAPVSIPYEEVKTSFADPSTMIPPRFGALPEPVATWLAGDDRGSREVLRAALVELATMPDEHPARATLLARIGAARPRRVAQAGLAVYRDIARSSAAWGAVTAALEETEARDLVDGFLDVWRNPHGIYWYGDLSFPDRVLDGLAREPAVESQMLADVAAALAGAPDELAHRRAERAAYLLGRARTVPALTALVAGVRATRGHPLSSDQTYHSTPGLYEGLVLAAVPAVVPTLLLDLGTSTWRRHQGRALGVLATLAPARVGPLLVALADAGVFEYEVVPALKQVGDDDARAALARMCTAPPERPREWARQALVELGVEPPAPVPVPAPAELVVHPSASVRDEALRAVDRAGDRALLRTLLIGAALDDALRARAGDRSRTIRSLTDALPERLRRASLVDQLAWLDGDGAAELPAQVRTPAAEAVLAEGIDAVAARLPRMWPRLDAASEAALIAEEAAVLAALRDGSLAVDSALDRVVPAPAPVTLLPADRPAPPPIATPLAGTASAGGQAEPVDVDAMIDELLGVMAREEAPSAALLARAGLDPKVARQDAWDRARTIRDRLVALDPARAGARLLAALPALHDGSHLPALAELVLPATVADGGDAQVARLWDEAHGAPWTSPARATDLFASVAGAPALFAAILDEVSAPDDGRMRDRTRSAFELLGGLTEGRETAAAAVIARLHADRARADEQTGWRDLACRALRKLGERSSLPTAILELAGPGGSARRREELLELLGRGRARELTILLQAVDLPDLAVPAVKAIGRSGLASPELRDTLLAHPYWRIRVAAADTNRNYADGKVETYAVWAAIDAAGLPVSDDERRWVRSDRDPPGATWDELAAAHGRPIQLPPLPPARAGADAACADHRAWSLWALDERPAAADAVLRVVADELDRALAERGHARHGAAWSRWRLVVPDLPVDRAARLGWARARGDDSLSPALARILEEGATGAAALAAAMPAPLLVLPPELRAELEALEAPLVERGRALFRHGPDGSTSPRRVSAPPPSSGDSYF